MQNFTRISCFSGFVVFTAVSIVVSDGFILSLFLLQVCQRAKNCSTVFSSLRPVHIDEETVPFSLKEGSTYACPDLKDIIPLEYCLGVCLGVCLLINNVLARGFACSSSSAKPDITIRCVQSVDFFPISFQNCNFCSADLAPVVPPKKRSLLKNA